MSDLRRKRMEEHLFRCGYSRFLLQRMNLRRLISCYNWERERRQRRRELASQQQAAKIRQEFTKQKKPIKLR